MNIFNQFRQKIQTALQELAHAYRKTLPTQILGLTGSNGKTTTKELIASVFGRQPNT